MFTLLSQPPATTAETDPKQSRRVKKYRGLRREKVEGEGEKREKAEKSVS